VNEFSNHQANLGFIPDNRKSLTERTNPFIRPLLKGANPASETATAFCTPSSTSIKNTHISKNSHSKPSKLFSFKRHTLAVLSTNKDAKIKF
jgi:hypothetical protein